MDNVNQYSKEFKQRSFSSRNVFVNRGDLPLIISAGHGGRDNPNNIPNRKKKGSYLLADMYTSEIAEGIGKGIQEYYKCSPHLIINLISRRKLDVNRKIEDGTETKGGELIWNEYHNSVQCAIDTLLRKYNYGLLIDIHGHTHPHGMMELGYLLEPAGLKLNPEQLDKVLLKSSSIKSLLQRNAHHTRPYQIMLGIGDLISAHGNVNVVPSSLNPEANEGFYFRGGYTTQRYSKNNGISGIDVIQLEIPKEFRYNEEDRQCIIKVLVQAVIAILDRFYLIKSKL